MTLMRTLLLPTLLVAIPLSADAQSSRDAAAVQTIPNAQCMDVALTHEQFMDPKVEVPIYAQPDPTSPAVGIAGTREIVRSPAVPRNGFLEVLMANGRIGWMEARMLEPTQPSRDTGRRCVPVVLSNGRMGFAFR